jgi:hypothetical protein
MTDEPLILDTDLLAQMESRWHRQQAPVAATLRPGHPAETLATAFSDLGLDVPAELRTWWTWHDGADDSGPGSTKFVGLGWKLLSVADARTVIQEQRARATRIDPDHPESLWDWAWLPLCADHYGGIAVVDGTRDLDGPTPIRYTEPELGGSPRPIAAPSLGTAVTWWITALDAGAGYNATLGRWHYDLSMLDPDLVLTELI